MATHGRTGIDLERYYARKARPHTVHGMYAADGAQSKPTRMTLDEYLTSKRRRGSSSNKRRPGGEGKTPKAASTVTHYYPVRCPGLPNANDIARRERRAKARAS